MAINMTFIDFVTPIPADWLNNVNSFVNSSNAVNNIGVLRSLNLITSFVSIVNVRSYYNANGIPDGGGGVYLYDPTDVTSTDNGGTIIVDAANRRWKLQWQGVLNVKQFGAKGDGITDDAPAFQAAMTAIMSSTNGGTLRIPASKSNYLLNGALQVTFTQSYQTFKISGDGAERSNFAFTGTNGLTISYFDWTNPVIVEDVSFLTNGTGTATGLLLQNNSAIADPIAAAPTLIKNTIFRGSDSFIGTNYWSTCLQVNYVSNVNYVGVGMYGQAAQYTTVGVGLSLVGQTTAYSVAHNLIGCFIQNVGTAIHYNNYCQGLNLNSTNITACSLGIQIDAGQLGIDQVTITSCQFNCMSYAFRDQTGTTGIAISGNYFIIPYLVGVSNAAILLTNASISVITGNQFHRENALATGTTGVVVTSGNTVTVSGNSFYGVITGIWFQAGTTGCVAMGNSFIGCTNNVLNATITNNDCFDQRYRTTTVVSIGAVTSFQVSIPLPSQYFNAAPQQILVNQGDFSAGQSILVCVAVSSASSTSQAVFNVYPLGGGNIVAGSYRFDVLVLG